MKVADVAIICSSWGRGEGWEADRESLRDGSQVFKSINGETRPGTQISWLLIAASFSLLYIVL